MGRFKFQSRFSLLAETRQVLDPWGIGNFVVGRLDSDEVKAWQLKRQEESTFYAAQSDIELQSLLRIGAESADAARALEIRREVAKEISESLHVTPAELAAKAAQAKNGVAEIVLRGWDLLDEDGDPMPFTPENVRALFALQEVIPEGKRYAGERLGDAISKFLVQAAADSAKGRTDYLTEEAGPNSEGSSDGATPGPSSTT